MLAATVVGTQHTQATDQCGHFRCGQSQQLCLVHKQLFRRDRELRPLIVAEPVCLWLQHTNAVHVGHLLGRIPTTQGDRHGDVMPCIQSSLLHCRGTRNHDQICHADRLAKRGFDLFQLVQNPRQLLWLVGRPVFLRCQTHTGAIGPAAHVTATKCGGRRPGGFHQIAHRQTGANHSRFQCGHIIVRQVRFAGRNHILPDQLFGRHFFTQIPGTWTHIAVGQLEPGARKGIGELFRVLMEPLGDRTIDRIQTHRHIGGGHHGLHLLARIMSRWRHVFFFDVDWLPDPRTRRALGQVPLIAK